MQRDAKNARESALIGALPSLAGGEEQGGNGMYCNGSCEEHAVPPDSQAVPYSWTGDGKPFYSWCLAQVGQNRVTPQLV
jgi:hypothetical protein